MGRKKKVNFSDDVTRIPKDILDPYYSPFTGCEDDAFLSSLDVKARTLERCARILQRFIRTNIPHLRYFNNEKSRIIEEMDDVLVMKRGELERVSDCIVEMKREVEMEIAMEQDEEDCDGNIEQDADLMAQVDQNKRQVKELEKENANLKHDKGDYQKRNKKIAMDTFAIYESFGKAAKDVKGLQSEQKRLEQICDQYTKVIKTIKGMMKAVKQDIKKERNERQELEDCINGIIQILQERTNKRKLIGRLLDMKSSLSDQMDEYGVLPIEA